MARGLKDGCEIRYHTVKAAIRQQFGCLDWSHPSLYGVEGAFESSADCDGGNSSTLS